MTIPVSDLIADFRLMLSERWAYVAGGAQRGAADCSGAFVWAYRRHGASIYHGSNRIARAEVDGLRPIAGATLVPGMAAFKRRAPGEAGYALPEAYQPGGPQYDGDLNDYYHIGLIDEDTTRVLNAQSAATGFVASPVAQGWTHVGYLRQVAYEAGDAQAPTGGAQAPTGAAQAPTGAAQAPTGAAQAPTGGAQDAAQAPTGGAQDAAAPAAPASPAPAGAASPTPASPGVTVTSTDTAVVVSPNGGPVKMRARPSESCRVWTELPPGTAVTLRGGDLGGWTPIRAGGREGYMMSKFLAPDQGRWRVTFRGLSRAQAAVLAAAHGDMAPVVEEEEIA